MATPVRVKIAASGSGKVRKEAEKSQSALKGLAGGAAKWGGAVAVATGAMAVAAVNDFAAMDAGIREVATLIPGATQETVDALTSQINDIRTTMGQEGEAVTKAFYDSLSAGVSQEAVPEFVEAAGQLATATGSDIATAVDIGTTALNAFGLATGEATRVNDIMFATVQSGKTTLPELARAYSKVAAPANALGVSVEETNAMLAALTLQGVPTAEAATQIRAAFNELAKEGTGLGKAFVEVSGQSFKSFIAGGGTVEQAMAMLQDHSKATGKELVSLAGSSEAANAIMLASGGSADLYAGALDNISTSAGAVEEGFGIMSEGVAFQMAQFMETLNVAKETLGAFVAPIASAIMPAILGLVEALGPVVEALIAPLGAAIDALLPVITTLIDTLAGPLGRVLGAIGEAIATLAVALGPVIVPIIEVLANLFADVLVKALDILIPIVVQLIEIIGPLLQTAIETLMPVVMMLIEALGPIITQVLETLMPVIQSLAQMLGRILGRAVEVVMPIISELIDILGPIIMDVLDALFPVLEELIMILGTFLLDAIETVRPFLPRLMEVISSLAGVVGDLLIAALQILNPLLEAILPILLILIEQGLNIIIPVIEILSGVIETLIGWITDAVEWLGDLFTAFKMEGLSGVWDMLKDGFKAAINFIIGIWNSLDFALGPWTIPGWIPGIGGKTFGIADIFPDIPLLAEGGIVTEPTLAMVGEGGRDEAVLPLPDNWDGRMGGDIYNLTINIEGSVTSDDDLFAKFEDFLNNDLRINPSARFRMVKA